MQIPYVRGDKFCLTVLELFPIFAILSSSLFIPNQNLNIHISSKIQIETERGKVYTVLSKVLLGYQRLQNQ